MRPKNALKFTKMQGAGNDFVVVDAVSQPSLADLDFSLLALDVCRRNHGIGADGLLLLATTSQIGAAVRMRMWNPDGSEDMCGNGLRCIARLASAHGYAGEPNFTVETLAGLRQAQVVADADVKVSMGLPVLDPSTIPINLALQPGSGPLDYQVEFEGIRLACSTLSTGSTHTIIWRDAAVDDELFYRASPMLEVDARYPERTSVLWATSTGPDRFSLRIWERGVGETLACGTGACATAVAGQLSGRCGSRVHVQSKGGTLVVEWQKGHEIWMTGDAKIVYLGELTGYDGLASR